MNKFIVVISFLLIVFEFKASAQDSTARAQNVYVELAGQGLLFTANYDTRFTKSRNGIGGRAGIGFLSIDGATVTTIPIGLNYLLGKGKNFFEVGLGATYLSAKTGDDDDDDFFFDDEDLSGLVGTMSFGYRLQPVDSGFSFRGGLTPLFNKNTFLPFYGLSFGYTF